MKAYVPVRLEPKQIVDLEEVAAGLEITRSEALRQTLDAGLELVLPRARRAASSRAVKAAFLP